MRYAISLAAAAFASAASASPVEARANAVPIELSLKAKTNWNRNTLKHSLEAGLGRLGRFNGNATKGSAPLANDVPYRVAEVKIGGKVQSLIVDTGSGNTWCGSNNTACEPTSSGVPTGGLVSVLYGSGYFFGNEYTDVVSLGGKTIVNQSIGAATTSSGFETVDGILGLSPVGDTQGSVTNADEIPTVMNNLYAQGLIPTEVLGLGFRPSTGSPKKPANVMTIGGVNKQRFVGNLEYFPLSTKVGDAYWPIDVPEFAYGTTNLGNATCIVDSGTAVAFIPTSVYNAFLTATNGTTSKFGYAQFSKKPTKNLIFKFGSTEFPLAPEQYLIPKADYAALGITGNGYYAWVANGGAAGLGCIIGQNFMEIYYVAFDTTKQRLGFAPGRDPSS